MLRRVRALLERVAGPIPRHAVVTVGGFPLTIGARSPLRAILESHPDYSGALVGMVTSIRRKYGEASMIDVGANVGDTVALARSVAPIPIFCFEGDPSVFALLQRNIGQFQGVTAHRVFLGDRTENISAEVLKAGWNATIVPRRGGRVSVPLTTLDAFLEGNPAGGEPKILKIDTEGFDVRVLRGSERLLRASRPAILFEYNRNNMTVIAEEGLPIFEWLAGLGYSAAFFYDPRGRLILGSTLAAVDLVRDLHEYADGWNAIVPYYDVCVFHSQDDDVAREFAVRERDRRTRMSGPPPPE